MIPCASLKISGCVAVTANEKATRVASVPKDACLPAKLTVRNIDGAAKVFLKFVPVGRGGKVNDKDHGVQLFPGESFTWDAGAIPRSAELIAISGSEGSLLAVEGHWSTDEDERES